MSLFFIFWPHCTAYGILAPRPQIKPVPPSVEVWHLNYWTTSKVPTGIFIRGAICTHRHTLEHCVQVKDRSDKSTSQEQPRSSEARRGATTRFSLRALGRNQACRHLDFRLPASRTVRQYISVVLSHHLACGTLLQQT